MPVIHLKTIIKAPIKRVFDLSRSIDLHKISTAKTNEIAIAGKTSGLIGMNEFVTWSAKHFGFTQNLTSIITEYHRPNSFTDEMQKGAFKSFKHQHIFTESEGTTVLTDVFEYKSPLGLLGNLADILFLEKYMENLLFERNQVIKDFAETERWKEIL